MKCILTYSAKMESLVHGILGLEREFGVSLINDPQRTHLSEYPTLVNMLPYMAKGTL